MLGSQTRLLCRLGELIALQAFVLLQPLLKLNYLERISGGDQNLAQQRIRMKRYRSYQGSFGTLGASCCASVCGGDAYGNANAPQILERLRVPSAKVLATRGERRSWVPRAALAAHIEPPGSGGRQCRCRS